MSFDNYAELEEYTLEMALDGLTGEKTFRSMAYSITDMALMYGQEDKNRREDHKLPKYATFETDPNMPLLYRKADRVMLRGSFYVVLPEINEYKELVAYVRRTLLRNILDGNVPFPKSVSEVTFIAAVFGRDVQEKLDAEQRRAEERK